MSRLPLLSPDALDDAGRIVHDEIASSRGEVANVFRAMLHSPRLARSTAGLGHYLRNESPLPDDLRELAILAVAGAAGCSYEERQHREPAERAGLSPEIIDALSSGDDAPLDPQQRALAGYARMVAARQPVDRGRFDELQRQLGPALLCDLTILAGYYGMLAGFVTALEIEPEENR